MKKLFILFVIGIFLIGFVNANVYDGDEDFTINVQMNESLCGGNQTIQINQLNQYFNGDVGGYAGTRRTFIELLITVENHSGYNLLPWAWADPVNKGLVVRPWDLGAGLLDDLTSMAMVSGSGHSSASQFDLANDYSTGLNQIGSNIWQIKVNVTGSLNQTSYNSTSSGLRLDFYIPVLPATPYFIMPERITYDTPNDYGEEMNPIYDGATGAVIVEGSFFIDQNIFLYWSNNGSKALNQNVSVIDENSGLIIDCDFIAGSENYLCEELTLGSDYIINVDNPTLTSNQPSGFICSGDDVNAFISSSITNIKSYNIIVNVTNYGGSFAPDSNYLKLYKCDNPDYCSAENIRQCENAYLIINDIGKDYATGINETTATPYGCINYFHSQDEIITEKYIPYTAINGQIVKKIDLGINTNSYPFCFGVNNAQTGGILDNAYIEVRRDGELIVNGNGDQSYNYSYFEDSVNIRANLTGFLPVNVNVLLGYNDCLGCCYFPMTPNINEYNTSLLYSVSGYVLDTSGNPISGVKVSANDECTSLFKNTDSSGAWNFNNIVENTECIFYTTSALYNTQRKTVIVNSNLTGINITVSEKTQDELDNVDIVVKVRKETPLGYDPVQGAKVTVKRLTGNFVDNTDIDGEANIPDLEYENIYKFIISKDGFETITQDIKITETQITFILSSLNGKYCEVFGNILYVNDTGNERNTFKIKDVKVELYKGDTLIQTIPAGSSEYVINVECNKEYSIFGVRDGKRINFGDVEVIGTEGSSLEKDLEFNEVAVKTGDAFENIQIIVLLMQPFFWIIIMLFFALILKEIVGRLLN